MPISIRVGLKKDGTGCVFRSVSGDCKGGREVREMKDGLGEEEAF